jgi:cell division protease FtsH
MQLPMDEKHTHGRGFLLNTIAILFGGRAAERMVFNEITTGAGNDIVRASELARKMVCEWGMSDELGPMSYGKKEEQIFLGREITQHRDYSEQTAQQIDAAVKKIIVEANNQVSHLLAENRDILKALADELLEKETITLEDMDRIIHLLRDGQTEEAVEEVVETIET